MYARRPALGNPAGWRCSTGRLSETSSSSRSPRPATFYLTRAGHTQSIRGLRAGPGMIQGLGVLAVTGRMLEPSDFAGDPSPLLSSATRCGATVRIGSVDHRPSDSRRAGRRRPGGVFQIVGVLSPEFYFGRDSQARMDLLMPLLTARRTYMVRLREGVPREYAEQRITQAARSVATGLTPNGAASGWNRPPAIRRAVAADPAGSHGGGEPRARRGVREPRGADGAADDAAPEEIAVRTALGAERRHLARMLVAEGVLLCSAALTIGLMLTRWLLARTADRDRARSSGAAWDGGDRGRRHSAS